MRILDGKVRLAASDVANYLACRHLTRLDLQATRGEIKPPQDFDIGFQTLIQRGEAHERSVLERFRHDGFGIVEIREDSDADARQATLSALRSGVDVIYQGTLIRDAADAGAALLGRPDFLVRHSVIQSPESEPRPPSGPEYEVVDAKLARSAKARAVLQTTFYSDLLGSAQNIEPRWMHLALGNGEFASFKVSAFLAYERQTRRMLEQFIEEEPPSNPYPVPVEHCAMCRWSRRCLSRRREDDDLSLVAGISKRQRNSLIAAGVTTMHGVAELPVVPSILGIGGAAVERIRLQAKLQVMSERDGAIAYELLSPERDASGTLIPNRGLSALPEPTVGDLFFDIEGARYYSEDGKEVGLQYLFGIVDTSDIGADGVPRYTQIWCFDRRGEKAGFEELVDFITERRAHRPDLHVYHYNHYEPTSMDHLTELHETRAEAIGRLMGRFATREDKVDDLFRLGVFVDLYRVVRQGLRAGVESYSIKRLEPLCGYTREVELHTASEHLIAFEAALDEGTADSHVNDRDIVAGYNEDDCRATLTLRHWLEERRGELATRLGEELPRPLFEEPPHDTEDPEVTTIQSALLVGLPQDRTLWSPEQTARALLADLIDWHRREAKPAWWRFYYLLGLTVDELILEPDAIGGLQGGEVVAHVKRSVVYRFTFPPQEHRLSPERRVVDPATRKEWTIWALDDEHQLIDLKIGVGATVPLPASLIPGGPPGTTNLRRHLRALGDRVVRDGMTPSDAATALLLRARPAGDDLTAGALRQDGETASSAATRLALAMHESYLPIQGPPGTGKTFTGAEQVLDLIARRDVVGITGPSHAVIHNLLTEIQRHAAARGMVARIGQRADEGNPFLFERAAMMSYEELERALRNRDIDIAAGTPWMWARAEFENTVDTLFVDEAGQMSLANVLAIASAGRNLIMLGDPQQLAQPSQAAHPPGAQVSALEHILSDRVTMPPDAGLLLDRTWRMHPNLCRYTSEAFYDGKLGWVDGLERQAVLANTDFGADGLRVLTVQHEGNTNTSPEEAREISRVIRGFLGQVWVDHKGTELAIGTGEILVVTPYNAQVREIEEAVERAGCAGVRIGTVDKFQGREAPIVLYSMATSSADDAPRGMEFLYDLHRLNVATSRARALAIVVASPDLVRVMCGTPRQMLLANALCRVWEERVVGSD